MTPRCRPRVDPPRPCVNVLFVDHTLNPSGAAISLGTLVRHLPSDFCSHFIVRKRSEAIPLLGASSRPCYVERWMPDFPTAQNPRRYPTWLWAWHFSKMPIAFAEFRALCHRWRIGLVHCNESCLVGYTLIARALGLPAVLHARCSVVQEVLPMALLRAAARHPRLRALAIDDEVFASLPRELRVKGEIVYNPISMPTPDPSAARAYRERWGLRSGDLAIGQVANLQTTKGTREMLELARRICADEPRVKFVYVGDDSGEYNEGPALKAEVARLGLGGRVVFAGRVSDVHNAYAALDVTLCLFSKYLRGVGRTVYEAAMAGKPMVLTLAGDAMSGTLCGGALGLVSEPEDLEGVERSLRRLIADETARREIGAAARKAIGERQAPGAVAARVAGIYRSLVT